MANSVERFFMDRADVLFKKRYERYFLKELKNIEEKSVVPIRPLTKEMIQEIKDYYGSFGYNEVRTDWHEYINAVTGTFSPQMIPEDFYHNILERIYNRKEINGWEDKSYMSTFLPDVQFPDTIFCNVNGYFLDNKPQ